MLRRQFLIGVFTIALVGAESDVAWARRRKGGVLRRGNAERQGKFLLLAGMTVGTSIGLFAIGGAVYWLFSKLRLSRTEDAGPSARRITPIIQAPAQPLTAPAIGEQRRSAFGKRTR